MTKKKKHVQPPIDPRKAKPWLLLDCVKWLDENLTKKMVGIEYGGGSSTPWLCRRLKKLYTVDASPSWSIAIIRAMNKDMGLMKKWRFVFVNSDWQIGPMNTRCGYKSTRLQKLTPFAKGDLESDYCNILSGLKADFILVDGAVRRRVLRIALDQLKPGGILMVDNMETMAKGESGANAVVPHTWKRKDFKATSDDKIPSWQHGQWLAAAFRRPS